MEQPQLVWNSAARLLTRTSKKSHAAPIFGISLHWLPACFRLSFKILTFRAPHGWAPCHMSDLMQPYSPTCSLRSWDPGLLVVPHTGLKSPERDWSFPAVTPRLWNALPISLHCLNSVDFIPTHLRSFLFQPTFSEMEAFCVLRMYFEAMFLCIPVVSLLLFLIYI